MTQRLHIKKLIGFGSGGGLEWGLREKKKLGHWMFFLFCGMCLFLGILKICANGWFGSAIERAGFDQVSSSPAMKLKYMSIQSASNIHMLSQSVCLFSSHLIITPIWMG